MIPLVLLLTFRGAVLDALADAFDRQNFPIIAPFTCTDLNTTFILVFKCELLLADFDDNEFSAANLGIFQLHGRINIRLKRVTREGDT